MIPRTPTAPAADRLEGARPARPSRGALGALLALAGLGFLSEALILYSVVGPLSLLDHAHLAVPYEGVVAILGWNAEGLRSFLLVALCAVGLYLISFLLSRRCQGRAALALILGFSTLFSLTLLLAYPGGANDIFTNVMDGRMAWLHGLNPITLPPRAASADPFFRWMTVWQDERGPYGPVWYLLLWLPTRLTGSGLVENLVAFRALTLPFLVGSAYLAARIAGARRPRLAPAAALLVGWSPLLLWESAVNGHNDIVMAALALFALERAQRRHWEVALPLLALSVLVKYVSVILVPLFVLEWLRDNPRRELRSVGFGALLGAGVTYAALSPFWAGTSTFGELLNNAANRFTESPAQLLAALIEGNRTWGFYPPGAVGTQVKVVTLFLFGVAYSITALRLWEGGEDLPGAVFYAMFFYLVCASWWFQPWYVGWLVVLGGGLIGRRAAKLAMLFSICALFEYVVLAWRDVLLNPATKLAFPAAIVTIVFVPAVAYWARGLTHQAGVVQAQGQAPVRWPDAPQPEIPEAVSRDPVPVAQAIRK